MRDLQVRHLVCKRKTNKRGVTHEWWYWQPPNRLQKRFGLHPRRLAKDAPPEAHPDDIRRAAIDEAERLNAEYDRLRGERPQVEPAQRVNTIPWLVAKFKATARYTELAKATQQRTYDCWWRLLEKWSEHQGHPSVKALSRGTVVELYEHLSAIDPETGKRHLSRAKNIMASLRRLLSYAYDCEIIPANPALKLEISDAPERYRIAEEHEIKALVDKAAEMGLPSVGLAARIAADTGLRRWDALKLPWESYDDDVILVVPHKTAATDPQPFPIPLTDEAQQALSVGRRPSGPIIVYEKTGRPYTPDHFSHVFREVADAAGLIGLWYHDLRRTAVVHLARAGCSISEISSVTGHSPEHCHRILKRYMPRDAQTARNAIAKVKEYRRRVGTGV